MITPELKQQLGPLAALMGIWEGDKGDDHAPSSSRDLAQTSYRERLILELMGPVQNHEQNLHVLRYSTRAWPIGHKDSFHEELGYWSWEPKTKEVVRCFLIPRGISVIAGGEAEADAKEFTLRAQGGSCTFGICTNPFLDREFKILSYEVTIKVIDENTFSYEQDTVIQMPGKPGPFHHRDRNTLKRVAE